MRRSGVHAAGTELLALNPSLGRAKLSPTFASRRRVQVRDVLTRASASRLLECLQTETTFNLVVNSGDKVFDLPPSEQAKLSEANRRALALAADKGAQSGFQYIYENHRLTEAGEPYAIAGHFLAETVAFLNGDAFLSFVRETTGISEIRIVDAQATRYRAGHFLTTHHDNVAGKNRLAAYVLNMTPIWRADWGGLLLFLDDAGNVSEGFVPSFNALNIFAVPQSHLVSQVSTFAGGARYAITGWLRG
jgi:Rps23 Pro-64 3,4-dihydroxylase Tpa1-like proline 4-hydroxylase